MEIDTKQINKADFFGLVLFTSIVGCISFCGIYFLGFLSEILTALSLSVVNFLAMLFIYRQLVNKGNAFLWGVGIKGAKSFLWLVIFLLVGSGNFFEKIEAFCLFFMGFFFIGFIIELFLLNYKKQLIGKY